MLTHDGGKVLPLITKNRRKNGKIIHMDYIFLKWAHIISSTILFGTGIGSAFYMFMANRQPRCEQHLFCNATRSNSRLGIYCSRYDLSAIDGFRHDVCSRLRYDRCVDIMGINFIFLCRSVLASRCLDSNRNA